MIWPSEALLLASTKLKTRRIRLIITVLITSLLFSVLVFLADVVQGACHSLQSFSKEGYGNQFYVQASPLTYQIMGGNDLGYQAAMEPVQKDLITRKKAAAKKLNVDYDEKSDSTLPLTIAQTGPNTSGVYPNFSSKYAIDFIKQKNAAIPGTTYDDFQKLVRKAGAVDTYRGTKSGESGNITSGAPPQVSVLVDGKEDLEAITHNGQTKSVGLSSITSLGWRSTDKDLLKPFVLPGQTLAAGKDGTIPTIAPYSAAEQILGLKALPQTAPGDQKLARLTAVRKGIAGKTAQICYRNSASTLLLNDAVSQQKEILANKNNKDYVKPALLYKLPDTACGPVTIASDKRTDEVKKADSNQKLFEQQFGQSEEPVQGIVTVRIIGINPDVSIGASISPSAILAAVLTSSIGGGWVSPSDTIAKNQLASIIQGGTTETVPRENSVYYAKFNNLDKAQRFIKKQSCDGLEQIQGPNGANMIIDPSGQGSFTDTCIKAGKVFTVSPYGNSAGAVEQFRKTVWNVAKYILLVIVVIASLVMMGNIGKIIADSRRETAVFRALGSRRLDIAEIYLAYAALVSLLITASALLLGSIGAQMLSSKYSPDLSVTSVLAYNAQDIHKQFSLYGINLFYLAVLSLIIVSAGLLSAVLPLLTNIKRNPIRDMRDEN